MVARDGDEVRSGFWDDSLMEEASKGHTKAKTNYTLKQWL